MTLHRNACCHINSGQRPRATAGFTLVEIAIVIVIVSILLTMGIAALNAQLTNTAISVTKKKQSTIQDSLTSYLGLHNRLPCPDTDYTLTPPAPDGIENRTIGGTAATPPDPTQACLKSFGIVPYTTLGLPQDAALDGWDNYFSYYVSNVTPALPPSLDWTLSPPTFQTGNLGAFNVYSTTGPGAPLASVALRTGAVVVIVSHGKNGNGAITIQGTPNFFAPANQVNDEYFNTLACKAAPGAPAACTTIDFWKRDATESDTAAGGPFDDIVLFLMPNDLIAPLAKDGTLQGPVATTRQLLSNLSDQIIGGTMAAGGVLTIPASLGTDAWGTNIQILPGAGRVVPGKKLAADCLAADLAAVAYTLVSYGPDGQTGAPATAAAADDISLSVSVSTLMKTIGGANLPASGCGS